MRNLLNATLRLLVWEEPTAIVRQRARVFYKDLISAAAISDCTLNRKKEPLAFAGREAPWYDAVSVVDEVARGWEDANDPRVLFARNDYNSRSVRAEYCARQRRVAGCYTPLAGKLCYFPA